MNDSFVDKESEEPIKRPIKVVNDFAPTPHFAPGQVLGESYEVIEFVGRGGMGEVYRVHHRILDKDFALKIVASVNISRSSWRRLQNEARALAQLNHPSIITIFDMGLHNGAIPYYAMDFVKGCTLADRLKASGPVDWPEAVEIFEEICRAISYMHNKGIIHRDLKPSNIMLIEGYTEGSGKIKLLDFGSSKWLTREPSSEQILTTIGRVCGSPYYLSPEQCEGKTIDARSDIYSLGCAFFEVLTGSVPFAGESALETMSMHVNEEAPSLGSVAGCDFPADLEIIVLKMMAKAPADRYHSAYALSRDLRALLLGRELSANRKVSDSRGIRQTKRIDKKAENISVLISANILRTVSVWFFIILTIIAAFTSICYIPSGAIRDPKVFLEKERQGRSDEINGFPREMAAAYSRILTKNVNAKDATRLDLSGYTELKEGVNVLMKSDSVSDLRLSYSVFDGATIAQLPYLQKIKVLYFNGGTKCTPLLLALSKSDNLEQIYLDGTDLTAADIALLAKIKSLRTIMLNNVMLTRADLLALTPALNLEKLFLDNCGIHDDAIPVLERFRNLKFLSLSRNYLTKSDIAKLRLALHTQIAY